MGEKNKVKINDKRHKDETQELEEAGARKDGQKESEEDIVSRLNDEIALLKDKYLRTHAEMENIRKRLERERQEIIKFGKESLLRDMLVVYDAIEKAITTGKKLHPEDQNFIQGMEMIEKLFLEVLKQHNVEPIKAKGGVFDPMYHEAMLQIERDDMDAGRVADEIVKGFMLYDRVLRPAKVSVSKESEKIEREEA